MRSARSRYSLTNLSLSCSHFFLLNFSPISFRCRFTELAVLDLMRDVEQLLELLEEFDDSRTEN